MNREDLVKLVCEKTGITKKAAEQAQKAVIEGFSSTLEKGDSISLVGFGSFKVVERAAPGRPESEYRRKDADPGVQGC